MLPYILCAYHPMNRPLTSLADGFHLFEVQFRAEHAARPGFRITELILAPHQKVPWHFHTHIEDTFYVISGQLRLFLRDPKQEVRLQPGQTYTAAAQRPHLVTNGGEEPVNFLVLQGMGQYDFVPLTTTTPKAEAAD